MKGIMFSFKHAMQSSILDSLPYQGVYCDMAWLPIYFQRRTGSGIEYARRKELSSIHVFTGCKDLTWALEMLCMKGCLEFRPSNKYVEKHWFIWNVLNFLVDLILTWVNMVICLL